MENDKQLSQSIEIIESFAICNDLVGNKKKRGMIQLYKLKCGIPVTIQR